MKLKTEEQLSRIEEERKLTHKEIIKYKIASICILSITIMAIIGTVLSVGGVLFLILYK